MQHIPASCCCWSQAGEPELPKIHGGAFSSAFLGWELRLAWAWCSPGHPWATGVTFAALVQVEGWEGGDILQGGGDQQDKVPPAFFGAGRRLQPLTVCCYFLICFLSFVFAPSAPQGCGRALVTSSVLGPAAAFQGEGFWPQLGCWTLQVREVWDFWGCSPQELSGVSLWAVVIPVMSLH